MKTGALGEKLNKLPSPHRYTIYQKPSSTISDFRVARINMIYYSIQLLRNFIYIYFPFKKILSFLHSKSSSKSYGVLEKNANELLLSFILSTFSKKYHRHVKGKIEGGAKAKCEMV